MTNAFSWPTEAEPDERCLHATDFLDADHPVVIAAAERWTAGCVSEAEKAAAIYTHVRDDIRYDPYSIDLSAEGFRASAILQRDRAFCVPKAIAMAAVCRAAGIPSLLGFADVINHLSSKKLLEATRSEVFAYHGYTVVWVEGAWRKATPTFNVELCQKAGIPVLDFDGRSDAVFHPYDKAGRQHMEYVLDRGWHWDFDRGELLRVFREMYPHWFTTDPTPAVREDASFAGADFEREVENEAKG